MEKSPTGTLISWVALVFALSALILAFLAYNEARSFNVEGSGGTVFKSEVKASEGGSEKALRSTVEGVVHELEQVQ